MKTLSAPYKCKKTVRVALDNSLLTIMDMNIFEIAKSNQIDELKEALKQQDPNQTDSRGSTPLIIAAYYNNAEAVQCLIDNGALLDLKDMMGNTALMGVCFKGYSNAAKILLEGGADANCTNGNGASALTFAATFGHLEIAKLLISHGADLLNRDRFGKNPIDYAMIQENHQCYEYLVAQLKLVI